MKNIVKIPFVLTILSVALLGCSGKTKVEQPKPNALPKIQVVQELSQIFSAGVASSPKHEGSAYQLDRFEDKFYSVSPDGDVIAFNGKDRVWKARPSKELSTGVSVEQGVAVVGSRKGQLYALDANTGATLWQQQLTGSILSPSLIFKNRVITISNDGTAYAHDATSGQMLWNFDLPSSQFSIRGYAAPIVIDERTIGFATANAYVYAVDVITGVPRWQRRVAVSEGRGDLQRLIDIDGRPVVINDKMITVSYQGQVTVIDVATQRVIWSENASSLTSPATDGQSVFIANADGRLVAYDLYTGQKKWENDQLLHRGLSNPAVLGSTLIVGDYAGVLHLLNPMTGELTGRAKTSGDVRNLRVEDNLLYVSTTKGNFSVWQNR